MTKKTALLLAMLCVLSGCKFYGSSLPPEYPMSMDNALGVATARGSATGGDPNNVVLHPTRPNLDRPTYTPQKEMAVVAPPRTLLVWTYPHVTEDNTRVFGSWSTIFLNERYEWVPPSTEVAAPELIPTQ